ncbi:MAG: tetratricopeptide repeat protein [Planctomycetota bacterium]|nr:tetratricopeptide repeat protein [Planctomycetota bacterium]MDA1177513.1 tetratricopeptide repeat protein [Planctomycetota bacterium]
MSVCSRVRRQQLLMEADGYLDLGMLSWEEWQLPQPIRDRLADRALTCLDRLDAKDAQRAEAQFLRGRAHQAKSEFQRAVRFLRTASRQDPKNLDVYLSLGWCYKRLGKLELAIRALENALDVDNSQAILYYNLACYWSLAGNIGLSLSYLGRALQMNGAYRDMIATEPDFDPVRSHPEFLMLTSVVV